LGAILEGLVLVSIGWLLLVVLLLLLMMVLVLLLLMLHVWGM